MQNAVFDNTISLLATTMDYAVRRHQVIAANLANVETPNYKAKDLPFEALLRSAVVRARGNPKASLRVGEPKLVYDVTGELRGDGNNVNAENEMIKLLKNSGKFNLAAELIQYKFRSLREAMRPIS
ncbi:MAG: flagellar basal-body rod protein FlgB [Candidatus Poribacteria bacterium]|nr:MAG: flagellar basal-body rod protein FlgB [Candidatus Poribacteria bacterium]